MHRETAEAERGPKPGFETNCILLWSNSADYKATTRQNVFHHTANFSQALY